MVDNTIEVQNQSEVERREREPDAVYEVVVHFL